MTEWYISAKSHRARYLDSSVDHTPILSLLWDPFSVQKSPFLAIETSKLLASQNRLNIVVDEGASEFQNLTEIFSIWLRCLQIVTRHFDRDNDLSGKTHAHSKNKGAFDVVIRWCLEFTRYLGSACNQQPDIKDEARKKISGRLQLLIQLWCMEGRWAATVDEYCDDV